MLLNFVSTQSRTAWPGNMNYAFRLSGKDAFWEIYYTLLGFVTRSIVRYVQCESGL
jgi:hypothetical protein